MFETELTQWWSERSDDERQKLEDAAATDTLDDEVQALLEAMTARFTVSGVMTLGDGTGVHVPRWNPIVRDFVRAR